MRVFRFIIAAAIALGLAGSSAALTPDHRIIFGSKNAVHDGISLDFRPGGKTCVKAPSQPANCAAFTSLFTFTRNSPAASYRLQTGLIGYANENQWLQSQTIDNGSWTKTRTTVTANSQAAPDGTTTADTLAEDGSAATTHFLQQNSLTTGLVYTESVYAKAANRSWMWLQLGGGTAFFNLSTCVTGTVSGTMSATATSAGNGWCRATLSGTATNASGFIGIATGDNGDTFSGLSQDSIYLWGAQLQTGATAGTYLATTAAAKYDQPRIEYDASGNVLGLLIEGSRTNRALWSNDVTNAAWVKVTTTTAQTATGPDGVTNSATTLTATGANSTVLQAFVEAAIDSDYCAWIKRRTGTGNIDMTEDTGATWTTMAVTSTWTKFCAAHQSFLNPNIGIRIVTSGDAVDVWGNQLEAGAFGSSTIPTTTVAIARGDDIATRTFGAEYNLLAHTTYAEVQMPFLPAGTQGIFSLDGSGRHLYFTGAGANVTIRATATTATTAAGMTDTAVHKIASSYDGNGQSICLDGGPVATAATAAWGAGATAISLGAVASPASSPLYGHIRRLDYYPTRKTNAFLQAATLP